MVIKRAARAGTLESSDICVVVRPSAEGVQITLHSSVEKQFGRSIRSAIREIVDQMGIENVSIEADDHGALDCTIRARVETALERGAREEENGK
jgi:citrate lyase subunit gamma (acyl carrier protein)